MSERPSDLLVFVPSAMAHNDGELFVAGSRRPKDWELGVDEYKNKVPRKDDVIRLSVVKYDANGKLDSSFGKNGTMDFEHPSVTYSKADTIVVQNDGKLLVGGVAYNDGVLRYVILRLNGNGDLDHAFAQGGVLISEEFVTHVIPPDLNSSFWGYEWVRPLTIAKILPNQDESLLVYYKIDKDNKIFEKDQRSYLKRYLPSGLPDLSFGKKGYLNARDAFTNYRDESENPDREWDIEDVSLTPDGKIMVLVSNMAHRLAILHRYDVHGKLDLTFQNQGRLVIDDPLRKSRADLMDNNWKKTEDLPVLHDIQTLSRSTDLFHKFYAEQIYALSDKKLILVGASSGPAVEELRALVAEIAIDGAVPKVIWMPAKTNSSGSWPAPLTCYVALNSTVWLGHALHHDYNAKAAYYLTGVNSKNGRMKDAIMGGHTGEKLLQVLPVMPTEKNEPGRVIVLTSGGLYQHGLP